MEFDIGDPDIASIDVQNKIVPYYKLRRSGETSKHDINNQ